MRESTLSLTPTKTYDPISVNLKEKQIFFSFLSLFMFSLSSCFLLTVPSFYLLSFDFLFFIFCFCFLFFFTMCASLIRIRFYPKTIYLFSVQFSLNEFSPNNFLTSKIFVKILSLESLSTYHLENRKKIPIVSELYEIFLGHYIFRDKFNDAIRFVIRDLDNFLGFPEPF